MAGRATHQILGGPNGLDEALYVRLRTRAGIYPAAPIAAVLTPALMFG